MSSTARRLPDFYIIGAQKSGTASLAGMLASRADVFMSTPREPMFFCRDDVGTHPHSLLASPIRWRAFDWDNRREELLADYSHLYDAATAEQHVGEGSTTYLVAERAAQRIAAATPGARIVALLRNPIDRAYSAYFHHLKNMRVVLSFENQLKFEPGNLLDTGRYRMHLERYFACFPRTQLLVLPFEQFRADTTAGYYTVSEFLGLPPLPAVDGSDKTNEALIPRFPRAQRLANLTLRALNANFEGSALRLDRDVDTRPLVARAAERALRGIGRLNRVQGRYPPMNPGTRAVLQDYFARENRGLTALTGVDFARYWPEFGSI